MAVTLAEIGVERVAAEVSFFGPTICNEAELISLQLFITVFIVLAVLCTLICWLRCIKLARDIRYKRFSWMHTTKMKNKVYEQRGNEVIFWFVLIPAFLAAFFILVALLVNCSNRTPAPVSPSPAPTAAPTVPTQTSAPSGTPTSSPTIPDAGLTFAPTNSTSNHSLDLNSTISFPNMTNVTNSSLLPNSTLEDTNTTIAPNASTGDNSTVGLNETSGTANITQSNSTEGA